MFLPDDARIVNQQFCNNITYMLGSISLNFVALTSLFIASETGINPNLHSLAPDSTTTTVLSFPHFELYLLVQ